MLVGVHQFLPTFEPGAIGSDALKVQAALRDAGYESEIFAQYVCEPFVGQAHEHTAYGSSIAARPNDQLIYHMALGSDVADWLNDRSETLLLRHHNITPVDFYSPWPDANTYGMAWGRHQLHKLQKRVAVGTAVSEFNRRELEDLHYRQTAINPLLLDLSEFDHADDSAVAERLTAVNGANWLFVGWIAPHKCQHDIIRAFSLYKRLYDAGAHLTLVGRTGLESYQLACEKLIAELGLTDSVTITGRVTDAELGAYYRHSDILVSMSEHEGVGIPLLEAMHNQLPVVAYSAAAIPETVGDAGVLLTRKKPALVAAAVNRVVTDQPLRTELLKRATKRLRLFSAENAKAKLIATIEQSIAAAD